MKSNNGLVSVIIPNYNRKELLIRAIKSIMSQSYKNFEIIIVDDNSDFDVETFINANIDYPIRFLKNFENSGPSISRNKGVSISNGKYVAFLDSDDYWDINKLKEQVCAFNNNPNLDLVYCDQWIINQNGEVEKSSKEIIDEDLWDHLLNWWTAPNTSTLMFNKKAFSKLNGFDHSLTNCEDHDLWMRVAKNNMQIYGIDKPLSFFSMEYNQKRLSFHYTWRFLGMDKFLCKWKNEIIKSKGKKHYKWFSDKYRINAAYPIFLILLKDGTLVKAARIFYKYLLFNSCFYYKMSQKVFKKTKLFYK